MKKSMKNLGKFLLPLSAFHLIIMDKQENQQKIGMEDNILGQLFQVWNENYRKEDQET